MISGVVVQSQGAVGSQDLAVTEEEEHHCTSGLGHTGPPLESASKGFLNPLFPTLLYFLQTCLYSVEKFGQRFAAEKLKVHHISRLENQIVAL